jgi:hypothetical protein
LYILITAFNYFKKRDTEQEEISVLRATNEKLAAELKLKNSEITNLRALIAKMADALTQQENRQRSHTPVELDIQFNISAVESPSGSLPPNPTTTPITPPVASTTTTTTTTTTPSLPAPKTAPEEDGSRELILQLLQQDREQRENELKEKRYINAFSFLPGLSAHNNVGRYLCRICYEEYPIESIYLLDGCFHRYCRDVCALYSSWYT